MDSLETLIKLIDIYKSDMLEILKVSNEIKKKRHYNSPSMAELVDKEKEFLIDMQKRVQAGEEINLGLEHQLAAWCLSYASLHKIVMLLIEQLNNASLHGVVENLVTTLNNVCMMIEKESEKNKDLTESIESYIKKNNSINTKKNPLK